MCGKVKKYSISLSFFQSEIGSNKIIIRMPLTPFPYLTFNIYPKKDISTFFSFVQDAEYDEGRNLEWAVFKNHPKLRKYFEKTKFIGKQSDISEYVERIYSQDEKLMYGWKDYCETVWSGNRERYYEVVHSIFDASFWPDGKYIAYPTIWGMYPRFLEDKTFQLPYAEEKRDKLLFVIAHEMLHFIFYEYFFSKYPEYREGDHDFFLWNVSEIFNTIVQGSITFPSDMNDSEAAYPEHEKIVSELRNTYIKISRENVNECIETIVKLISEK